MSVEWDETDVPKDLELPKSPEILSEEEYRAADAATTANWAVELDGAVSSEDQEAGAQKLAELRKQMQDEEAKND